MVSLFEPDPPPPPKPHVEHFPGKYRGRWTLEQLRAVLPLQQMTANIGGRGVPVPRLECWHGDRAYAFGGRVNTPQPWPELLLHVRHAVMVMTGERFDACFVNLYRDGGDSIAWHADDEPWIGPVIASVSFGAARRFGMRLKSDHKVKYEYTLRDGDLFVMQTGTQEMWEHAVPKTSDVVGPRLSLTFRQTKVDR